jgi:hypothetical protein
VATEALLIAGSGVDPYAGIGCPDATKSDFERRAISLAWFKVIA